MKILELPLPPSQNDSLFFTHINTLFQLRLSFRLILATVAKINSDFNKWVHNVLKSGLILAKIKWKTFYFILSDHMNYMEIQLYGKLSLSIFLVFIYSRKVKLWVIYFEIYFTCSNSYSLRPFLNVSLRKSNLLKKYYHYTFYNNFYLYFTPHFNKITLILLANKSWGC